MPRIYKNVKPPQNKAADPVKETKKVSVKEKSVTDKPEKKNGKE